MDYLIKYLHFKHLSLLLLLLTIPLWSWAQRGDNRLSLGLHFRSCTAFPFVGTYEGAASVRYGQYEVELGAGGDLFEKSISGQFKFYPFRFQASVLPYVYGSYRIARNDVIQNGVKGADFHSVQLGIGSTVTFLRYGRLNWGFAFGMTRTLFDDYDSPMWISGNGATGQLGMVVPINSTNASKAKFVVEDSPGKVFFALQQSLPSTPINSVGVDDSITFGILRPSVEFHLGRSLYPYMLMELGWRKSTVEGVNLRPNHLGVGFRAIPFRSKGWSMTYEAGVNFFIRNQWGFDRAEFQFGTGMMRQIWPGADASLGVNFYTSEITARYVETYLGLRFALHDWSRKQ